MQNNYYHPRYWPTWIGLGFIRLLSMLPLPVLAACGSTLGWLTWHLFGSRRRIALRNIAACFPEWPEEKTTQVASDCFGYIGQSLFFSGVNWWASPSRLDRIVKIVEREHYDQALRENKNIILLAPHFCALEIAGLVL